MDTRRLLTFGGLVAVLGVGLAVFARAPHVAAETRIPTDPSEVLERLPGGGANDPRARELKALQSAWRSNPADEATALELARAEIGLARSLGDPRHLGRAQAALAPWWNDANASASVLVLAATIEQSLHAFDEALVRLDRAVQKAPDDPQAWLTRAVILSVLGRYDEARASCAALRSVSSREGHSMGGTPLPVVVCDTSLLALTGQARGAYQALAPYASSPRLVPEERAWASSVLGEYAERLGEDALAERHYREALAIDGADAYTRGALADLLLDQGRDADVVALLAGHEDHDGLLLRLAIAERRTRGPKASAHEATLAERIKASRERGDVVHRREEARFYLDVRPDPSRALELARANWGVQKEPWDARVLLESALAARDPSEAEPARAFVAANGLEHPRIHAAITALGAAPR